MQKKHQNYSLNHVILQYTKKSNFWFNFKIIDLSQARIMEKVTLDTGSEDAMSDS